MTSFLDVAWLTVCGVLVFIMQAGFLCLEAGATRSKNRINIAIKNFTDLGLSVLIFWAVGYGLMFGTSAGGWIGTDRFIPDLGSNPDIWGGSFFLFQTMFCSTAVTILSGATAERIKFKGYLAIAALISGIIYPVFGHWVWQGINQSTQSGWLAQRGFVDFAGSTVVHSVGGWCSLAAVLVVGPRLGRFSNKRQFDELASNDLPIAFLGTMLLWFGWFGFNGGSNLVFDGRVPIIIANTLLAGSAGLVTAVAVMVVKRQTMDIRATMNGSIAGLVAVTAGCHAFSSAIALFIGIIGSLLMMASSQLLEKWKIDDVVGAIPVHLVAGIWGTLAVGLFGNLAQLGTGLTRIEQIKAQLSGIIACSLWAFGLTLAVLLMFRHCKLLRVSAKHEYIGLNISEHGAASSTDDIYSVMRHHAQTGDLKRQVHSDPFTEVGRVGQWYNQVIAALETAIATNQAIISTAIDGILTVDCDQLTIQSANPSAHKLFSTLEHTLHRQPFQTLIAEPLSQEQLYQIAGSGCAHPMLAQRQNGKSFPIELSATTTTISDTAFFTIFIKDISARKLAEDALSKSRAQEKEKAIALEKAMAQLRRTQAQLIQRERIAGQGQLVAGIAHEINNPVGFIYGNLEHAKDYVADLLAALTHYQARSRELPDEVRSQLEIDLEALDLDYITTDFPHLLSSMQAGTERIQNIVQQLRTFSRYDESDLKSVDLHLGIDSTLTMLTPRLLATAHRPAVHTIRNYGELPLVECHASALNRVFLNLLTNALDAFERGQTPEPVVEIKTYSLGDRVMIAISNNGPAIPAAEQAKIFDPFFTTQPVGQGTGLGCTISYQIVVEQHHGLLTCRSSAAEDGRLTTCLTIELPIRLATHGERKALATLPLPEPSPTSVSSF